MRSGRRIGSVALWAAALWLAVGAWGCRSESPRDEASTSTRQRADTTEGDMNAKMEIDSTAFAHGHAIPERHTGDGKDTSPPLAWYNVPAAAKELALIVDDPDAPRDEPWVHWVLYKIPPTAKGLPEGVPTAPRLDAPAGALQGHNSWPTIGYKGPQPPEGTGVHHYHFKLYALDAPLDVRPGLDKDALLAAMKGHILAQAELIGTYEYKK